MPFDAVATLLASLTDGGEWPPRRHRGPWREVARWRAFLENDREALARIAGWTHKDRRYKVDPLGERIAEAWADYLFGDEPTVTPANDRDHDLYSDLVEGNDLPDELAGGARTSAGEGEVFWRIGSDPELADVPTVTFHSRDSVAPLFVGRRLAAVAFVAELAPRPGRRGKVYRHVEVHEAGRVVHYLFQGSAKRLGQEVELTEHEATAELPDVWAHGLPMLAGRVVNKRGRRFTLGRSEFLGIEDFLLELNEALTIGGENMRLTAKKRIVAPASSPALRARGAGLGAGIELIDRGDGTMVPAQAGAVFDAAEDVLIADALDDQLGAGADPYRVLEYSYDATALIAHKRDLVETAISRVGLTAQAIGVGDPGGYAISGTAVRLRFIPTDRAGARKGRPWDKTVPHVLHLLARVDALSEEDGGFGRVYVDLERPPAVERANPLPPDEVEEASIDQALIAARARSAWTSIKRQHPDWTDDQVQEELDRIKADQEAAGAGLGAGVGF